MRLHRAECTRILHRGCGAVRVVKRLFSCPVALVLWLGRCAGSLHGRSQGLPAPRRSNQRAATPDTLCRPPGRPCRKESRTVRPVSFRIFLDRLRLWVVKPRTRVSCFPGDALSSSPRVSKRPSERASSGRETNGSSVSKPWLISSNGTESPHNGQGNELESQSFETFLGTCKPNPQRDPSP